MPQLLRTSAAVLALMAPLAPALAADVDTIAIVTPEQGTDFGWNQQGIEGLEAAAEATGTEAIVAQGLGYGNVRPTLRELAEDGAQLIIAHASGYATEAIEVGREMGVHVATGNPSEPPLIGKYELMGEKGAFLAGVLAAKMTRTKVIGIVVSSESPNWNAQSAGFAQGVRHVSPEIELRYAIIGPAAYADVAGARRVTESVIASDADIIFGQGNGSSFGMIQAVETVTPPSGEKVWFIDVIGDKTSIDKGHLLSSVIWDMAPVFEQMVADVRDDSFGTKEYALRLEDGSQRLLKTDHIPAEVWDEIETVKQQIIDGTIEVTVVTEPADTRAMMSTTLAAAE
ncbi:putative B6 ABC transporter substrate-binding protein [Frigidibacter sp. MR17.24]|uniref:putative B6 ABC transporter substrate-binding protein n=1 Tax=Frigidibacter sp. MR17.24 TaxID=3127345 RepID=UPI003012BF27